MEHTNLMILIAKDGHTPVASLSKETYVASSLDKAKSEIKVVLHHQINANPLDYGDHLYTVDYELNKRQFEQFRHWPSCPLHQHANPSFILVKR